MSRATIGIAQRVGAAGVLAAVLLCGPALRPAHANDPLGACCFANGSCQDLQAVQCTGPGQTFIGEGTSCDAIDCAAPVAAPLLSFFGVVAAIGALAALGTWRLVTRRRRS